MIWMIRIVVLVALVLQEFDMADHITRMEIELNELNTRTNALISFMENNPVFKTLNQIDQDDLKEQYEHMCKYHDVLKRRLNRAII